MTNPLRFNEALLIANRAFKPLQCIAWTQEINSELNLTVVDRANTRTLGHKRIPCSTYSDPKKLADVIQQTRQELTRQGFNLAPWNMPD
ncbi:hypothetical protein ACE0DR_03030 [Azotobacter sp. CWF10]